jgi:predicted DNA-binding transcriptional regulator YafY
MNRTDRLYALVEELRAVAPRPHSARWLASRFEVSAGRVLRIGYTDRGGASTTREIEPLGYVDKEAAWYLVAWCRLRDGSAPSASTHRRIDAVSVTAEVPDRRALHPEDLDIRYGILHQLSMS